MLEMTQYTGTKTIKACPMSLGEAEKVLVSHLSIEVEDFAIKTRRDANARIEAIHQELHELGYDENGNNL